MALSAQLAFPFISRDGLANPEEELLLPTPGPGTATIRVIQSDRRYTVPSKLYPTSYTLCVSFAISFTQFGCKSPIPNCPADFT